jgi:hypothetical protein
MTEGGGNKNPCQESKNVRSESLWQHNYATSNPIWLLQSLATPEGSVLVHEEKYTRDDKDLHDFSGRKQIISRLWPVTPPNFITISSAARFMRTEFKGRMYQSSINRQ